MDGIRHRAFRAGSPSWFPSWLEENAMITSAVVGAIVSLLLVILAPPILRSVARVCHWAADGLRPQRKITSRAKSKSGKNGER